MPVNPKSRYEPTHTIEMLQATMRGMETRLRKIIEIRTRDDGDDEGKSTIAEHDRKTKREKVLVLVPIEEGKEPAGPEGTTLDFKGEAWIEEKKTAIAVFR